MPPGEQATAQRVVDDRREAVGRGELGVLGLDPARHEVVELLRDDGRGAPARSHAASTSATCQAAKFETPSAPTSPAVDDLAQRAGGLVEPHRAVGLVEVEEVDAVGAEPLEAGVQRAQDALAGEQRVTVGVAGVDPDLGREGDLVPPVAQDLAEHPLALALGVAVGGVEVGDAGDRAVSTIARAVSRSAVSPNVIVPRTRRGSGRPRPGRSVLTRAPPPRRRVLGRAGGRDAPDELAGLPAGHRRRLEGAAAQHPGVRLLRVGEDRLGGALLDDPAGAQHEDVLAERPDDAEVVRDGEVGQAGVAPQGVEDPEDLGLDADVERARRLVEDEQRRARTRGPARCRCAGAGRPRTRAACARGRSSAGPTWSMSSAARLRRTAFERSPRSRIGSATMSRADRCGSSEP